MHSGLLVFSLLLIVAGFLLGSFFLSAIGVFLLIPAFMSPGPSRQPTKTQTSPPPRKPAPYVPMSAPAPATLPPVPSGAPAPPAPQSGYEQRSAAGNPALFPSTMFPSFGQSQAIMPTPGEAKQGGGTPETRDEFVEIVAVLAVLKLISG
jgi:hypothetical protein